MRRCREATDPGAGQGRFSERRMISTRQRQCLKPIENLPRTVNGIDSSPGRAAVGCLAVYGDLDIEAALVAERHAIVGSKSDNAEGRRVAQSVENGSRGIVSPRFPGAA